MSSFDFAKELDKAASIDICWEKLENKTIMITGATGLIGKYLIEVILKRNEIYNSNIHVVAVGRNKDKFLQRFADVDLTNEVEFYCHNVMEIPAYEKNVDLIVHMASNTHPKAYAIDPIGTEMANILGTYYLLQLASKNSGCRFVLASSGDIYGDNQSTKEYLSEDDCGYINCNSLRAGYIEGKRASEALCNAYKEANNVDFVIGRFCRLYGPTMQLTDSKAISQFINKAIDQQDIVLKSEGKQTFSYLYIFDAVTALLTIMANGETGNAYNIADNKQVLSLKELADLCAKIGEREVVFDLPDSIEKKGASSFQNVKLDGNKLNSLGWSSMVELEDGLRNTILTIRNNSLEVSKQC